MCMDCWREYGNPKIRNEKTLAAQRLIADVYGHHESGGSLHIVIDDWNLQDSMVSHCRSIIENPTEPGHLEGMTPERKTAELACCTAFESMTIEERASALAMFDGFITTKPTP